jgi:hypothetical protein
MVARRLGREMRTDADREGINQFTARSLYAPECVEGEFSEVPHSSGPAPMSVLD